MFGQEISNAKNEQRAAWLFSTLFRQPTVRSGTASRWNASPLRTVGCLKRVENSQAARCSFLAFEISCPNIACALLRLDKLVHQNQAGPQTARPLWFVWRNYFHPGLHTICGRHSWS